MARTMSGPIFSIFIHRAHDLAALLGQAEHGVEAVEHAAVVDADLEALEAHRRKDVVDDGGDLGIVHDVQLAVADDVDIRLIKLRGSGRAARARRGRPCRSGSGGRGRRARCSSNT